MVEGWKTKSIEEWDARVKDVRSRVEGTVLLADSLNKLCCIEKNYKEIGFNFTFTETFRLALSVAGIDPEEQLNDYLAVEKLIGGRIIQKVFVDYSGVTNPLVVEPVKNANFLVGQKLASPLVINLALCAQRIFSGLGNFPSDARIGDYSAADIQAISFQEIGVSMEILKEAEALGPVLCAPTSCVTLKELDMFRCLQGKLAWFDIQGMPRTNVRDGIEKHLAKALGPRLFEKS